MITFLALNTGAFTLIPMSAMNFLNAAGIRNSYQVIVPTILATACASIGAVMAAKSFQRLPQFVPQPDGEEATPSSGERQLADAEAPKTSRFSTKARTWLTILAVLFIGVSALELGPPIWRKTVLEKSGLAAVIEKSAQRKAEATATLAKNKELAAQAAATMPVKPEPPVWRRMMDGASGLAIPAILILAVGVAWARGVRVYEEFVDGAKEGFAVATRIMPYLVAMLAVLAILRESGAFQLLEYALAPVLGLLGFPVELLSLALMRPLSGSGAQGILNEILTRPDLSEMVKFTAAILYGSTETTFYVLTVYFGSVGIRRFRHALMAGLTADFIGMVAAVAFGRLLFG
jgi:spore maturation protein SpmB